MNTAGDGGAETRRGKDSEGRRLPFLTALFGTLTALLTVVSGGLGIWGNNTKGERDDLQVETDQQSQEVADLEAEKAALEKEVADLEEQLTTTTSQAPSPGSDDGEVFRATGDKPLVVPFNTNVDLDSQAPNWGTDSDEGRDIWVYGIGSTARLRRVFTSFIVTEIAPVDSTPTEQDCVNSTLYAGDLSSEQTRAGTEVCVRTSEGRFAYLKIAALDLQAGTATFDIVVWAG